MNLPYNVNQEELFDLLINLSPSRPIFICGSPGIEKSALVEKFAEEVGLPCVSLLGSQLAPEDIIGIPKIRVNTSEFLSPKMIARRDPYVLFLDGLNACSQEVRKAFCSLIHERRIGESHRLRLMIFIKFLAVIICLAELTLIFFIFPNEKCKFCLPYLKKSKLSLRMSNGLKYLQNLFQR